MKKLSLALLVLIFGLMTGCGYHDKPNPRIAESDAYYKKLDAQVAVFPNELATGKYDSMMLADTNYYLIKGGISAGKYVWDMSNRLRHLLDSIYKRKAMTKKVKNTVIGAASKVNNVSNLGGPEYSNAKVGDIINGTVIGYHLGSPIVTGNNNVGIYQGPIYPPTDPSEYQDKRYRHDIGWNKVLIHYDERSLMVAEDAMETFRQNLEAEGLFTKKVKAIWDRQYNYLKNYQPR